MKRADRDAWVADLRANPDKQGRAYLSRGGQQCCLGRLALLQGVPQRPSTKEDDPVEFDFGIAHFSECTTMPSVKWCEDIGFSLKVARELADLNDIGRSFAEIADHIEKHVPVED